MGVSFRTRVIGAMRLAIGSIVTVKGPVVPSIETCVVPCAIVAVVETATVMPPLVPAWPAKKTSLTGEYPARESAPVLFAAKVWIP